MQKDVVRTFVPAKVQRIHRNLRIVSNFGQKLATNSSLQVASHETNENDSDSKAIKMMHAKSAILHVINQIDHLLVQIEPTDYRRPLAEFDGNTLGQHFRHILEFFQCLEQGVPGGQVDYAARQRNLLYEESPSVTAAAFEHFVQVMDNVQEDHPFAVKAEFGGVDRPVYQSTLGRELLFVYDHAIHHLAIIKIGLNCQFPEIHTDKDLGVSPSTIKSRQMSS